MNEQIDAAVFIQGELHDDKLVLRIAQVPSEDKNRQLRIEIESFHARDLPELALEINSIVEQAINNNRTKLRKKYAITSIYEKEEPTRT